MFNITSKYFSIFNNKPRASWVAHITREFLTCCTCSYYSSMNYSLICIYLHSKHTRIRKNIFHKKSLNGFFFWLITYSFLRFSMLKVSLRRAISWYSPLKTTTRYIKIKFVLSRFFFWFLPENERIIYF